MIQLAASTCFLLLLRTGCIEGTSLFTGNWIILMQTNNDDIQFVIIENLASYRVLVGLQTGGVAVGKDGSVYSRRSSGQEAPPQVCCSTQRPAKWEGRETRKWNHSVQCQPMVLTRSHRSNSATPTLFPAWPQPRDVHSFLYVVDTDGGTVQESHDREGGSEVWG